MSFFDTCDGCGAFALTVRGQGDGPDVRVCVRCLGQSMRVGEVVQCVRDDDDQDDQDARALGIMDDRGFIVLAEGPAVGLPPRDRVRDPGPSSSQGRGERRRGSSKHKRRR